MDAALIAEVIGKMQEIAPLAGGSATVGFDGFTDTIVRVVRGSAPDGSPFCSAFARRPRHRRALAGIDL